MARARAVLTALAVVLGVAMVSGTFILTDTINKAFDSIFASLLQHQRGRSPAREVVKDAASGNATVPASLLHRVRAPTSVAAATGAVFNLSGTADQTKLIGKRRQAARSARTGSSASASTRAPSASTRSTLTAGAGPPAPARS